MKVLCKAGVSALLAAALTIGMSSCHTHDVDIDDVTPPVVSTNHIISGSIAGIDGEPVAGATITLSGADNATVTTDENGYFVFTNVKPGTYHVEADASGKLPEGTTVTVSDGKDGQNIVWNVMLASSDAVKTVNVNHLVKVEADVTSEALKNNDKAEIPIEVTLDENTLSKDATITIKPVYTIDEAEDAASKAVETTMLIGANVDCSDETVTILKPIELTFEVDPETISAISTQKLENGHWVDIDFTVEGNKIIVGADEFTSYALIGDINFTTSTRNVALEMHPDEWDNLYGSYPLDAEKSDYKYKVGMDIQSKGTTVFTALLIEVLARHFGANSFEAEASYPLGVNVPIGTYLAVRGVQHYNTVSASLGGRKVSGLQYGDVTISTITANRQHNGGSSRL